MFKIFVDSAANIPAVIVKKYDINVISFVNVVNGKEIVNFDPNWTIEEEREKGKEYYNAIRNGADVKTGLISIARFSEEFQKAFDEGYDVLYFSLSKNISGNFNSARLASLDLLDNPNNHHKIRLIDSLNASLAQGILAIYASEMRKEGKDIDEVADYLETCVPKMNGVFTVGDLKYLSHTGRIKGSVAFVGNALKIKPILTGSEDGHIILIDKAIGVNNAYKQLANKYEQLAEDKNDDVYITHTDNEKGALFLLDKLKEKGLKGQCHISIHEPMTGSHLGPGSVALFFKGIHK